MGWFRNPLSLKSNLLYTFEGRPESVPTLPGGMGFTELDANLVNRYFASSTDTARRARYLSFLKRGLRGFMVFEGDQWAAVGWVVPVEVRGMPAHLPASIPKHPWLAEAHTFPEYRRRGLHKFLLAKRLEILAEENPRAAVTAQSDVNPDNLASRRSHLSVGFKPDGWVRAWTVGLPRVPSGPYGWRTGPKEHPPLVQNL